MTISIPFIERRDNYFFTMKPIYKVHYYQIKFKNGITRVNSEYIPFPFRLQILTSFFTCRIEKDAQGLNGCNH